MTSTGPPSSLAEGTVIAKRYRLLRLLGRGGMGSVWVARHLTLNTDIAIKFIEAGESMRQELLTRFAREAMAAANVKSSHIVNVFDYGTEEEGRPYIAMELLQGEDLAHKILREKQLQLQEVVNIISQACRGLGKAHTVGIVHRDIKPENLFLAQEEDGFFIKILDFGVAKADASLTGIASQTSTGMMLGTPLYMSPEQALGTKTLDARSDLYSLGVVAYTSLAGVPPFMSEGLGQLLLLITSHQPPPLEQFRSDLPPQVGAWLLRALQKDPADRFQTAREMGDALLTAAGALVGYGAGMRGYDARQSLPAVPVERPSSSSAILLPTGPALATAHLPESSDHAMTAVAPTEPSPGGAPAMAAFAPSASVQATMGGTANSRADDPLPKLPKNSFGLILGIGALGLVAVALGAAFWAMKESPPTASHLAAPGAAAPSASVRAETLPSASAVIPSVLPVPAPSASAPSAPPRTATGGNPQPKPKKVDLGKYGVP